MYGYGFILTDVFFEECLIKKFIQYWCYDAFFFALMYDKTI